MPAEPHGAAEIGPGPGGRPGRRHQRVVGQERRQVGPHADGPDARAAAAVGDAERLVQVQVRHVGAEAARPGQADHGVEVGAVEVHLPAGVVHGGRRSSSIASSNTPWVDGYVTISAASRPRVLGELGPQVVEVDVAGVVAGDDDHPHAGHHRGRGVGAVGRRRDEAHVAADVAAAAVVLADGEQPGQLALAAGVGLERARRRSR